MKTRTKLVTSAVIIPNPKSRDKPMHTCFFFIFFFFSVLFIYCTGFAHVSRL